MITENRGEIPERTRKALEKRWHKLLDDCIEAARKAGVENPEIYIEGEAGLYVTDGPSHEGHNERTVRDCAMILLSWPGHGYTCDVGAW